MSRRMALAASMQALALLVGAAVAEPLGLPPTPVPTENPQTDARIALGAALFSDQRFSSDGTVSCATCHAPDKAFTDSPLKTSQGVKNQFGTRNAPTVVNSAFFSSLFWDGRSPSLEDQSQHPFVNPIEMGLTSHDEILKIVRSDKAYRDLFQEAFGKSGAAITMKEAMKAIASFERTLVAGDSPFDKWRFGHQPDALNDAAKRGFEIFVAQGRCVSCHTIEQNQALFTDNRFHNIGVGVNRAQNDVPKLVSAFVKSKSDSARVDKAVLSDPKTSELGRFAATLRYDEVGAFRTPTLRNIALTAPYMHDGSLATLKDVVRHYNNGGRSEGDPSVNPYLSGGIRPLGLSEQQMNDLVAFLESLTSPGLAPTSAEQSAR